MIIAADVQSTVAYIGSAIDLCDVVVMVVGGALGAVAFVGAQRHRPPVLDAYRSFRRSLGRSILLGLEFLVVVDIIRTVAVQPNFRSVGVLAVIVVIRTFLSFSLELEITGRWPWQEREWPSPEPGATPPVR